MFSTVVRTGSFKQAAEELGVTPGAVSRQIRTLEEYFDVKLFARSARSVTLTPRGRQLHERTGSSLWHLDREIARFRRTMSAATVRLDCNVTFAMHALIPRLGQFKREHPDIHVDLELSDDEVDERSGADIYIRRNVSELGDRSIEHICDETSVLLASPELSASLSGDLHGNLRAMPRLGSVSRPDLWISWSRHHGYAEVDYGATSEFRNTVLAIQAATCGLGVLFAPTMFAEDLVREGRLIRLSREAIHTGSYWMVDVGSRSTPSISVLSDWIVATLGSD